MELQKINVSRKNKNINKIKDIYMNSFPKEERMPFFMMRLLSNTENTDFISFQENDDVCGFAYIATCDKITVIVYLAVEESLHSKGIGTQILTQVEEIYPNNSFVLYIERCDISTNEVEQRIRRKNFYLKNGYKETGYIINSTKEYQEILIKNGEFDKEEFKQFIIKYNHGIVKPNIVEN